MTAVHTTIDSGGRIVIPYDYRKKLNLKEGDTVTISLDEDEFAVRVSTARLAIKRMQKLLKARVPEGVSLSEELIAERREQAKKE